MKRSSLILRCGLGVAMLSALLVPVEAAANRAQTTCYPWSTSTPFTT